jgi:hypothetical protein
VVRLESGDPGKELAGFLVDGFDGTGILRRPQRGDADPHRAPGQLPERNRPGIEA